MNRQATPMGLLVSITKVHILDYEESRILMQDLSVSNDEITTVL